jgi:hypothetical protein
LFSLCLSFSVGANPRNVSWKDINEIKSLFYYLIDRHDFAYTLFGSKPMSLADISLDMPEGLPIHKQLKARLILKQTKGWLKAWEKNKDAFALNDFIFLDKEEDLFECRVLILINKQNLLSVLHVYRSIFKEEFDDSFNPESFLNQLERRETSFAKAIHNNQRLLGIMLGYGDCNATLYQERLNLLKEIAKDKKTGILSNDGLTQKLDLLETQIGDFSEFEEDPILPPLYFLADTSHPETIELKKKYENDRQQIERLMKKPHFADRILERLMK